MIAKAYWIEVPECLRRWIRNTRCSLVTGGESGSTVPGHRPWLSSRSEECRREEYEMLGCFYALRHGKLPIMSWGIQVEGVLKDINIGFGGLDKRLCRNSLVETCLLPRGIKI